MNKTFVGIGFAFILIFGILLPAPLSTSSAATSPPLKNFSIVLVPDTQNYWPSTGKPEMVYNQSKWIVSQKYAQNIKLAIHLGDIVNSHENVNEWKHSSEAMKILDGKVPYLILPGNHDVYDKNGNPIMIGGVLTNEVKDYDLFKKYFPISRFATVNSGAITPEGANTWRNIDVGSNKFMVVAMEYCPTWTNLKKVSEFVKAHSDKRVILATHAYLRGSGSLTSVTGGGVCGILAPFSTEKIWTNLVYPNPNIFLVVSGHSPEENHAIRKNIAGKNVMQMVIDYQNLPSGGNGYLKIITFDPTNDEIKFVTYSPWFKKIHPNTSRAYTFGYDMNPN